MLNFVFEDKQEMLNLFSPNEKIGGLTRVVLSPWVNRIRQLAVYYSAIHGTLDNNIVEFYNKNIKINFLGIDEIGLNKYIIPIGVNENPRKWIGGGYADEGSDEYKFEELFDKLNDTFLEGLRSKKAFLLIDSSLEGYHDQCIFDWIYDQCRFRHISPSQVIYVTGNSDVESQLELWKSENKDKGYPIVIPYSHFEFDIAEVVRKRNDNNENKVPNFKDQLEYKKKNFDNIKIYNFLNKKPRNHRVWFYHTLRNWNLLEDGLVSMNKFDDSKDLVIDFAKTEQRWLPETNETLPTYAYGVSNEVEEFRFYMDNLNEQATLDSWFSIVSEAQFEDRQGTIFLSEKVYKPIACQHPFVVLGNKHSLKELHKLGYKTFHDLIDESYDELDSIDRIQAIIDVINNLKSNPNKLQWFEWLQPKLEYNFKVLQFNSLFKPPAGFYKIIDLCKTTI
jgi:hypothetical protein